MKDKPFFSIVIPTYNRAGLIMKTLNSVFNQTFNDYEIIIVDNCSTDNTEELLMPLHQAGRVRFIKHDINYERAVSRNTGMQSAQGKFLTLLDSDDIMYPQNLEDAFQFISKNPDLNLFQNLYELIDENGKVIYEYPFPSLDNQERAIMKGNFLSCIGVFISESVYKNFRFDTSTLLQGIEDWEFWIRILADHKAGRINKINNGIVHHKGRSITKFTISSYLQKRDYVINKISSDPHLNNVYGSHKKVFGASCTLLAASMANEANLFGETRTYLKEAFNLDWTILFSFRYLRILQKALFQQKSKIDL